MPVNSYKRCDACKFRKPEWYGDSECRNPVHAKFTVTDGILEKTYPLATDILPPNGYQSCNHFVPTYLFKVKLLVSKIRLWWLRLHHPEKLL